MAANLCHDSCGDENHSDIASGTISKLQTLTLRFFDQRALGDLMSRVTNDIDNLNTALAQSVTQIVSSILTVIGVSIAMFTLSWQLAIVTLIIIPLIVFTTKQIIKRSSKNYAARQRDLGKLNGYIEEMITGSEVLTLLVGSSKRLIRSISKMKIYETLPNEQKLPLAY